MPDRGYTVNPVYTESETGEQVISDLQVSTRGDSVGRDGHVRDWQMDYIEDSEGRIHHVFENVELESDKGIHFDEDAYVEALLESHSEFRQAQAWANENMPSALLEQFNNAIDNGDLGELNEAVEWLVNEYRSAAEAQPEMEETIEDPEMDELSEEETEILNKTVDLLEKQEPAGEEIAQDWQEAVEQAQEVGDDTFAMVAAATAAFHSGEVSAEDAVNYCLNNANLKDLARVYKHLAS